MSSKITILKETAPTRCEICHQADCYNPVNNYCSRCNNIASSFNNEPSINRQIAFPQINYQLVQPNTVELTDFGANYLINYRWRSPGNVKRHLFILTFMLPSLMNLFRHFDSHLGLFINPLLLIMILIYLLSLLAVFINKTQINISSTKLIKTSGPLAIFSNKEIALADIKDVYYERYNKTDRLCVRLNNGELIRLIKDMDDTESIQFIEKTIKEKIKHLN